MYGFNTDNQTTSLLSGSLTAPVYDGDGGPSTYSAPTNGLTAGYNGVTFTFDGENRLTAGSSNGSTFPFTAYYDGDGMRTAFTTNNVTTYYLYDDESGGGVPVAELTYSSGNATTSLAYLNGMCADGWRLRDVVGAAYVETYDPQGSIVQSSLDNDALGPDGEYAKSVFVYDGFGALRGSASTSGSFPAHHRDPAGFGGEWGYYQDLSTGLEHLGARYYDGGTGRVVTRDPIGYGGGANLYGFCGNNPVNESDPQSRAPALAQDKQSLRWSQEHRSFGCLARLFRTLSHKRFAGDARPSVESRLDLASRFPPRKDARVFRRTDSHRCRLFHECPQRIFLNA